MARIERRRRVRCKLACEIETADAKRLPGRVVTLSEGGLALLARVGFEQGDAVRVVIDPKGATPIRVSAIVWNDSRAETKTDDPRLRRFGCVVSSPSDSFAALLGRMLPATAEGGLHSGSVGPKTVPVATPVARDHEAEGLEADLPRARDLEPPPKLEPEEGLPYFKVRLRQTGGPRTRIMTLQARSATQAEARALEGLSRLAGGAEGWGVLHVSKVLRTG